MTNIFIIFKETIQTGLEKNKFEIIFHIKSIPL